MATSYLDKDGLLYFLQQIRPNATPLEDGTASVGTAKKFANQDHVHPHDSTKVDKVSGKGLSTNDYTTAEKNKLAGIASGAEVNVQSNWSQTDSTADDYIKNKPTIPAAVPKTTTTPKMDGTAAIGSETKYAAGDHVHPTDTSRAPNNHASTATTYGSGTSSNYGHVKLSDATDGTAAAASGGTAATPKAVSDALAAAKSYADGLDTGVSDVTVDGTSVVTDGVAAVDLSGKVDKVSGKGLSTNDYTTTEKNKLAGIASGAEVNQNAFSKVKVGTTTLEADGKTDTLELTAGSNISLTPSTISNDKVTIAVTGIASGAEVNQNAFSNVKVGSTTIAADSKTDTLELIGSGGIVITPNATNDSVEFSSLMQYSVVDNEDGTITITNNVTSESVTVPDTTLATTSANGLMSSSDKTKLAGIAAGAEVNVNADWNATSGDAQILNKPTLGAAAAKGVVTSISSDSADLPTTTAVKNYVANAITGTASFQGTAPTSFAPTNYKQGWYWVVGTAGTYAGQECEPGDMIFALESTYTTRGYVAADFTVVQTNLSITSITNAEIDTIVAA